VLAVADARDLVHSSDKPQLGTPRRIGQGCQFYSYKTDVYKMHFFESPSGMKVSAALLRCPHCASAPRLTTCTQMVLNTSSDVGNLKEALGYIYDDVFVEFVVKNPLYNPGEPFQ
jgi:trafficking protein particle complex subunit 1